MSMTLGIAPPLDGLVQLIAPRGDAVDGLRAIGREVGGRAGRRVLALADSVERGEVGGGRSGTGALGPLEQTLIQAAAVPPAELAGKLARATTLDRLRADLTYRVVMVGWFSLLYGWLASLAGWWLIASTEEMVTSLIETMGLYGGDEQLGLMAIWKHVCIGLLVILTLLIALWSLRSRVGEPQWIERLWAGVPMIGPTIDAIELAGLSESLRRSVEAGWTYPDALHVAAAGTRSSRLRKWALASAGRINAGENFAAVLRDLPLRDGWLAGVAEPLVEHPQSSLDRRGGWQLASDRLHSVAVKRAQRAVSTVAPLATICSLGIAYTAVGVSLGFLKMFVELISTLT